MTNKQMLDDLTEAVEELAFWREYLEHDADEYEKHECMQEIRIAKDLVDRIWKAYTLHLND